MHSSRMRTSCAMTGRISGGCIPCTPPPFAMHAPPLPRMPPFTMHAPLLPCMPPFRHTCPPSNHACPPGATMHAPLEQPCMPPEATTHAPTPEQPHTHPLEQPHPPPRQPRMPPRATMHAPPPRSNHAHPPPVNRITDRCKNITFANYVCGR